MNPDLKGTDFEVCLHFADFDIKRFEESAVLKETCVSCFDSQDSLSGINLCLQCLNSHCIGDLDHYYQHYARTGHGQYLNVVRRIVKKEESQKNGAMEGRVENNSLVFEGYDQTPKYEHNIKLGCIECDGKRGCQDPRFEKLLVDILNDKPNELSEGRRLMWKSELEECVHTKEKPKNEVVSLDLKPPYICDECGLEANLWLCTSCGHIGCGRKQYGMSDGQGHALAHYERELHPLSFKIGTITKDSADTFCYACAEDRIDPHVHLRLRMLNMNPESLIKTEKSTLELNMEKNMNLDITLYNENKEVTALRPRAGIIGIENLGNTCYLSSVLQMLLQIHSFENSFSNFPDTHKISCELSRLNCLPCQLQRITYGVSSGRYASEENTTAGLSPLYLLILYNKKHPHFQIDKQQDALEFLQMLLDDISNIDGIDTTEFISSITLETTQTKICSSCNGISLSSQCSPILTLSTPTNLSNDLIPESKIQEELNKTINIRDCFECTFSPHPNQAICTRENEKREFIYTQSISKYPKYLIVSVNRFLVVNRGTIYKHNAKIMVPHKIDIRSYSFAPVPEDLLMTDTSEPIPEEVIGGLLAMGFPEERIVNAYRSCNKSTDIGELATAILSEADEPAIQSLQHENIPSQNKEPSGESVYSLRAFISHKGSQIDSGHYISHFFSDELNTWVTINDTKIYTLLSPDREIENGYIYLFEQR